MNRVLPALGAAVLLHALLLFGWSAARETEDSQLPPGEGAGIESAGQEAQAQPTAGKPSLRLASAAAQPAEADSGPASAGGGDSYLGLIRSYLDRRAREFSSRLARRGIAEVRFAVGADGATTDIALARSSGDAELDRAALELLVRSSPLPAPAQPMRLLVPIEFR